MKILLVEDEERVASFVKKSLGAVGYNVDVGYTAVEARGFQADNDYDLMVLDLMLPDGNGLDLAREFRNHGFRGSILMLTALSATKDKVAGLDAGADDYLPKPFETEELLARVRALLRRQSLSVTDSVLRFEDLEMNLVARKVQRGENKIELTTKEFSLLEYFMRNVGRPLSRSELIEKVWNLHFDPGSNIVDVYINMLRKKLEGFGDDRVIHTVVGQGYEMRQKDG